MKSTTGRYSYRQDVMSIPTRCRVGNFFCVVIELLQEVLTDKLDHKQTSRKDKQTNLEHVRDPSQQD